jgi:DegV family protein with EDD domain
MSIKIVTDSTCDLPDPVIARFGLTVVPLYINFGQSGDQDGPDLTGPEFYDRLRRVASPPTTAAPGPETFRQTYQQLAEAGATTILSIHMPASLSATVNQARLAATTVSEAEITVFEAQQLSLGVGFVVLAAAEIAASGGSLPDILTCLERLIPRIYLFAVLENLDFLRRSGRLNRLLAGLGDLLQIKPIFTMHAGQTTAERVRSRQQALNRLVERAGELGPLQQAALLHTGAPERAHRLGQLLAPLLPQTDLPLVEVSPVVGSHIGPGAVGLACVKAATPF